MKLFRVFFKDGNMVSRYSEDKDTLLSELQEEFPNREIYMISEVIEKQ